MIKNILWDFDGVILDSMEVRDFGFKEIFKPFSDTDVERLITYHRINGGLSRYVKIRYFYEEILNQNISDDVVTFYANKFSEIMRKELTNPNNLISDSLNYIKSQYQNYNFHIVSGSDQNELRFLCDELGISKYFQTIHGSPTPKKLLVEHLLAKYNYAIEETCLIGDSVNDYEAAMDNKIEFYGYNNDLLKEDHSYINTFKEFNL
ncbi:HAD family hydrolase [Formosa sp. PL04]|uniref:HAD family hydrolase n=1 Tax=Formosa sp. PL04 TaxID=3081755 RepID=UPI002981A64D|nr:HAD hydrolase-like protein [Formosa sp. PL04]MDW5288999.1 HAD hydrolase-like protein [Formosa sp. PL04]